MLMRIIFILVFAIGCTTLFIPNSVHARSIDSAVNLNYESQESEPVTGTQSGSNSPCVIREGLQVMMQNVTDVIDTDTDGHVELSFRNPLINDCVIQAELRIVTPNELLVFGKEGVVSGGAGTLNAIATVPPGTERISVMDFKGVTEGKNLVIRFSGNYWPVGNKSSAQGISTKVSMSVVEPSSEDSIAQENRDSVVPDTTQDRGFFDELSGSTSMVIMGVIIIVLVILVVIFAMIAIMKRK